MVSGFLFLEACDEVMRVSEDNSKTHPANGEGDARRVVAVSKDHGHAQRALLAGITAFAPALHSARAVACAVHLL